MTEQPKDGGPAFPFAATDPSNEAMQAQGMSLRDWFAGQALSGFMMAKTVYWDDAATMAYKAADAMLAARGAK